MKRVIGNIITVILVIIIIFMSVLLLSHNEHQVSQFGNKTLLIVDEDMLDYKAGSLLVVTKKDASNIQPNDYIFYYDINNKTKHDVKSSNKQLNELIKNCTCNEYMYLYENSSYGKLKSIFYYIRCSVAHGDFVINNKYIIGQAKKKDLINCKYKILIKTLTALIDIVENFNVKK